MRRVDFPTRGSCHKGGQGGAHNHQSRRQTADGGCRRAMTVLCRHRRRRSCRSFPFSAHHLLLRTVRLSSHGRYIEVLRLAPSEIAGGSNAPQVIGSSKELPNAKKVWRNKSNRQSLLRKKIVNEQAVIDGMDSLACARRVPPTNSAGVYRWPLMRQ